MTNLQDETPMQSPYRFAYSVQVSMTINSLCKTLQKGDKLLNSKTISAPDRTLHALAEAELIGALNNFAIEVD